MKKINNDWMVYRKERELEKELTQNLTLQTQENLITSNVINLNSYLLKCIN
jgi:hypothetical protein